MRPCLIAALLLTLLGDVHAGIYATKDMLPGPEVDTDGVKPMPAAWFRDNLNDRIALTLEKPVSDRLIQKRNDYLRIVNELDSKRKAGSATLDDQINLSAHLMWVGKPREAVEVLEPLARGEGRAHFMVLSNLATAYELAGQPDRVPDYLQQARSIWPTEFPGFTKEQLAWFKDVDRLQFRLVMLRRQELARQAPGTRLHPEGVDPLFGDPEPVKYVSESGSYEAGKLAAKEQAKLPKDALARLQQLVLWLPDDTRLLWQVGELMNAQGQPADALKVFSECVDQRSYNSQELREHRRVLQAVQPEAVPPPPAADILPNRQKAIVVGGMAGILIVAFAWAQVREFRRRRARAM